MRRLAGFLLILVTAGALAAAGSRAPEALGYLDAFRVDRIEIHGLRHLDSARVVRALDLPAEVSVWDDPAPWTDRLLEEPLVRRVRIHRRLPSTLVIEVEERRPVALVATPVLEVVDGEGHPLPLDPTDTRLDLPLIIPPPEAVEADRSPGGGVTEESPVRFVWSRPVRVMAGELQRLEELDPAFLGFVSELSWARRDVVVARWGDPAVEIVFRPPLTAHRLREAVAVLSDASGRRPGMRVRTLDLRFEDQVVVRYERLPGDAVPPLRLRTLEEG